jgi:hypothetical protein
VLGGATTVLYGMIAVLGARIWVESRVDFRDPVNLVTAAVAVIVGAANYTLTWGDLEFNGIALGSFGAIIIYRVLRGLGGTPVFAEGAIASPAAGSGVVGPEGSGGSVGSGTSEAGSGAPAAARAPAEPDPGDRPPREP